jgi:hypothetical protein
MNLLELRKYAIDRRVEIKFGNPLAAQVCLINNKGQVKIPGEDKDFRIEEVLDASEEFIIIVNGSTQHLTREAMARTITQSPGKKGTIPSTDGEE